ncbi:MAG: hypothetical protein KDA89_10280, partial [Planctomycetaceae bacterium]|nr:hypothetical protein [Planctomycetaceae bacterium]
TVMMTLIPAFLLQPAAAQQADAAQQTNAVQQTTGRYEKDMVRFEQQIADGKTLPGRVMFIGSSSIRLWNLERWFPGLDAVNHGFGGSEISDSIENFDRIVTPARPKTILLYAGDNDIGKGKTAERVHQDFRKFAELVRTKLNGQTHLAFIAIKPSLKRWSLAETMKSANDRIRTDCAADEHLTFVDIWQPMLGDDGLPRAELFAKDGLHLNDTGYELWTQVVSQSLGDRLAVRLPDSMSHFQPKPDAAPLFEGQSGQWDDQIRERGWIMRDGDRWRLWYTGYNAQQSPLTMKLGHAVSADGIHWTRDSRNPIFDAGWVEDMMIVRRDGTWYMFAEGKNDQAQLLTSADGLQWTRVGALDVRLANGTPISEGPYGTPTAWYENDQWYLFYERRDAGIWLATSPDLKVWTNISDAPVIRPGPEPYDRLMIALNQIVKTDGRYFAVLHGTGSETKPRDWCTYTAASDDLIHWQKTTNGPLLPISDNRSSGQFLPDGHRFLLYTMHARIDRYEPDTVLGPIDQ